MPGGPEMDTDRIEPPSVTMVLRSKPATKSIKQSLANKTAIAGLVITAIYFAVFVADIVYPEYLHPSGALNNSLFAFSTIGYNSGFAAIPPFSQTGWYILGNTIYNIPILPVMLASLKYDIAFALAAVLLSTLLGLAAGLYAGTYGGVLDRLILKITDFFLDIPLIALVIFIAILFANLNLIGLAIAVGLAWWPSMARFIRDKSVEIASGGFAKSMYASGNPKRVVLYRHVLPNIGADLGARVLTDLGVAVQLLATVDFLFSFSTIDSLFPFIPAGYHIVSLSLPELGNLVLWGTLFIGTGQWWRIVVPGLFLVGFIAGVNLLSAGIKKTIRFKRRKVLQ